MVGFRVCGQCSVMPLPLQVTSGASLVGAEAREEYLRLVGSMQQKLQAAQYNSSYFDRGAKAGRRLCTPEGWFSCQVSHGHLLGPPGRGLVSWSSPRVSAPLVVPTLRWRQNPWRAREDGWAPPGVVVHQLRGV